MTLENTNKLIDEIIVKRKEFLASEIQRFPASNFRASDIHECDRYMIYSILEWDKRSLHDEGLQAIFDRGKEEEKIVIRDLMGLGFNFAHQQNAIEIKNREGEIICRGHIDGKIIFNNEAIPVEIKSMNGNMFNTIKSLDDFQKRPLYRKYLRQMQLYLFGNNEEAGLFILSDLQGHYKILPVILDYGECELILKRLEIDWKSVKRRDYPERIEYRDELCGRCAFNHICLPRAKHEGAKFIDSPDLEAKLERREELKPSIDEFEEIDKGIKENFKGIPQVFVGKSWQIDGKAQVRTSVDTKALPDDIKKQYEKKTEVWITKIIKI